MKRTTAWIGLAVMLCSCAAGSSARAGDDGPSSKVSELKALTWLKGSWDGELVMRPGGQTIGLASEGTWTLGRRFLVVDSETDGSPETHFKTMWTYDERAEHYRRWIFTSHGVVIAESGSYDEATRTFTFEGSGGDLSTKSTVKREGNDKSEWTMTVTNIGGETIARLRGTNKRRK